VFKKLLALLVVVGLLGMAVGCAGDKDKDKEKDKKAKDGAKKAKGKDDDTTNLKKAKDKDDDTTNAKKAKDKDEDKDKGGKLTVTVSDATVKQKGTAKLTVKVARDKVEGAVTVTATTKAKGVTIDPKEVKLEGDKDTAEFTVKAAADAEVSEDATITVIATGGDGKVKAEPKDVKLTVGKAG